MNSILFSALAGFVNIALLYWLSPIAALIALVIESVALFCLITKRTQWVWTGLIYVASSVWALLHFLTAMNHQIPLSWQNRVVRLDATIVSMVIRDNVKQSFTVKATQLCLSENCFKIDAKIELNAYETVNTKAMSFEPGQRWIFYARLKRLHHLANLGVLRNLDWAKGDYAVGSVLSEPRARLLKPATQFNINHLRQTLAQQLARANLNQNEWAIISALTLGDRSHLSSTLWTLFQQTGVLHLMAISGLHVGLVATFVYGLMYLLLWPWPRLFHHVPRQKIAMWAAVLMAWSYGALAGFAVSTVRACLMISLYVLAKSVSRQMSCLSVLLWSSLCILIVSPLQSLNISFWLSFIAVYSIAFLLWIWPKQQGRVKQHVSMQVALSLCLLPISLLFFQRSPLNAPLANLVAIPWVSFIILPGSLLALILHLINPLLAHPIFIALQWNIEGLIYFLQKMVRLFPYQWWHGAGVLSLALMSGGLFLILLPRAWQLKGLGGVWLLLAFAPLNTELKPPLRVTIFDVGEGLAVLLQTQHHMLLYDTGPSYYGGGDAATTAMVPFLKRQSAGNIDVMVVSHQDADHSGGVATLLKQLPVTQLITSPSQSSFVKKIYQNTVFRQEVLFNPQESLQLSQCYLGQQWRWDGVEFHFLSPKEASVKKGNNLSCVLLVSVAGHHLLLPGDIEAEIERDLVVSAKAYFPIEVLVAPHHGSRTSSSRAFIAATQPKIVVFSTGYLNRYHFPAKNVQKRYQIEGILAYNTADNGAISFSFNEQGEISPVTTARQDSAWQAFLEKIYVLIAVGF